MTSKTITGIVDWLKGWFAPLNHASSDTTYGVADNSKYGHVLLEDAPAQNSSNGVKSGGVYTALAGKSNTSHGHGNIDKDGILKVNGTAQATKSVCTDANGKITSENKNNHSHGGILAGGTITSALSGNVNKILVTDSSNNIRVTSVLPQTMFNLSDWIVPTAQTIETQAFENIGTNAGENQHSINYAIDTKIGQLMGVEFVRTVTSLPTASASTMNALYLVTGSGTSSGDAFGFYVTVKNGSTYDWERVDDATMKGFLTKSVADGYYAPISHSHLIDSQTTNPIKVKAGESYNNVITLTADTSLGLVLQAFGNAIGTATTKAQVKSIELIPKATDNTGAIKITYNDE